VVLAEALSAARAIRDEQARAAALIPLAPHLPAGLLSEALNAARAIGDVGYRSRALAALVLRLVVLPSQDLRPLWAQTLPCLAARTRRDLLTDLRSLTPVLLALARRNASTELREVAQAITDVARWWP
jgi:hypothetical protein